MKSTHFFSILLLVSAGCSAPNSPETTSTPPAKAPVETSAAEKVPAPPAQPTPAQPRLADSELLQGNWKGEEIGGETPGSCRMAIVGNILEFHGANTNEWYKIAFTLHEDANPKQLTGDVKECPAPDFVGKSIGAIYKLENGTLTISGNEPGKPVPATFDEAESRRFVFKRG